MFKRLRFSSLACLVVVMVVGGLMSAKPAHAWRPFYRPAPPVVIAPAPVFVPQRVVYRAPIYGYRYAAPVYRYPAPRYYSGYRHPSYGVSYRYGVAPTYYPRGGVSIRIGY